MQLSNIATGAACHYSNTAGTFPTSKISCFGVGVSQHWILDIVPITTANLLNGPWFLLLALLQIQLNSICLVISQNFLPKVFIQGQHR